MIKKIVSLLIAVVLLLFTVSCRCSGYIEGDDVNAWQELSQFSNVFTTTAKQEFLKQKLP